MIQKFSLKGMIIMDNAYCHDGYCDLTLEEGTKHSKLTFNDKLVIGGYVLLWLAVSAFVWYEALHGVYIDPASLN
jgi:hypothetical protein